MVPGSFCGVPLVCSSSAFILPRPLLFGPMMAPGCGLPIPLATAPRQIWMMPKYTPLSLTLTPSQHHPTPSPSLYPSPSPSPFVYTADSVNIDMPDCICVYAGCYPVLLDPLFLLAVRSRAGAAHSHSPLPIPAEEHQRFQRPPL